MLIVFFQSKSVCKCEENASVRVEENNIRDNEPENANSLDSIREIHDVFVDVLNVLRRERGMYLNCYNIIQIYIRIF